MDDPNSDEFGKIIRPQNGNHLDFPCTIQLASFRKCGKSWNAYKLIGILEEVGENQRLFKLISFIRISRVGVKEITGFLCSSHGKRGKRRGGRVGKIEAADEARY